jgi:hypothetical protein
MPEDFLGKERKLVEWPRSLLVYADVASGGAVVAGDATVPKNLDFTASGGVTVGAPSYTNGFQYRKLITIAAYEDMEKFPLAFQLHVDPNLTITTLRCETTNGDWLPSEFVNYHSGLLFGVVRVDLKELVDLDVYVYYGGS